MSVPIKDQFRGCLIGQCLGDALGFPIEGQRADVCRGFVFNNVSRWFQSTAPEADEWDGQYTDDSQLARELLVSLVMHKRFDPVDYAQRIAAIFAEDRIVGRGIACDEAASRLNAGIPWTQAGCPSPSAGNGTAMRAAPAGMLYYDRPGQMIHLAHEQGHITHHDPRCSAGSVAIAGAVALALQGRAEDSDEFVQALADWMHPIHSEFAELVLMLRRWLELAPDEAVEVIAVSGKGDMEQGWPGISPFVIPSVLWSLYAFLRHPDNYREAVSTALAVGGDVDTTAAMTGAISGAYVGLEALPQHLTRRINDRGEWGLEQLIELADACYELTTGPC
jgi:ADP-ribosylglycohydrolase